jgi:TRAP-type transport system periplasmic protein
MVRHKLAALLSAACFVISAAAAAKTPLAECKKKIKADPKVVVTELKMVTLAPAGSQWAKAFQTWTDEALEESDCRLSLKWYWNGGGGGDELRMVTDLRQGQKHGAAMTAVGLGEIYRDVVALQLPGLFENWPALDATRNTERAFFEEEFRKRGFEILGWGDVGASKIMTVGSEIKVPSDLKDKRAWHQPGDPIAPLFFSKLGLKSAPMSIAELSSHLGKDIQVLTIAPYAAEQLQLASKITNLTVITTSFVIGAIVVKKEKTDAMPADLRQILFSTGKRNADALTATIRYQDGEALKRLKKSKVAYTPSPEQSKLWQTEFSSTRKALRGAPFTPEVFDRIVKH